MRRVATALMLVGLAVGAAVMTGASGDTSSGSGKTYNIQFDNAFGLTTGGDLKIGGVRAGQTSGFNLKKISDGRYVAVVQGKLTAAGVSGFHKDASCDIRPQSLIGEYFVDCQPGSSKQMLPNGGTVPVKQTASTIPPDLMQNVMRRPYRERFRLILAELGTGLAGRPGDLSQVLHRAAPGLRETSKVLQILGRQNQVIKNFITNSDTVVKELEAKKQDVAAWVKSAGHTAEISAQRQQALREQWRQFPRFLAELQPTMAQLGQLADAQTPLLRQVRQTTPQLKQFFADLGPFSEASRPSIKSLGQAAKIGNKAFKDSRDEIQQLADIGNNAPSAAKQTRQFIQSFDERNRSIEPDSRAKDTAPPAPDPAAYKDGQGFTGMESLLNYAYWQTLALNPYDQLGHLLRVVLFVGPCSPFQTGPVDDSNKDLFSKCNSWLGPNQPGVTTPDPTDNSYAALSAKSDKKDKKPQDILKPEATKPLPGQDNPSTPKVVLPPAVQQLLNQLPQVKLDQQTLQNLTNVDPSKITNTVTGASAQPTDNKSADKLLDFLMSP
ncbi:MAG TPA: MlaD family protein [Thermoleophilaceae bacterium]|nr:MlaD family protein [Thermoleophilaceae bacterium]